MQTAQAAGSWGGGWEDAAAVKPGTQGPRDQELGETKDLPEPSGGRALLTPCSLAPGPQNGR